MNLDIVTLQDQLRAELAGCIASLAGAGVAAGTVELDQTSVGRVSRMDAIQQQAMAIGLITRLRTRRRKIEAALARIEAGTFGLCCACQDELDSHRLAADPAAVFCAECAEGRGSGSLSCTGTQR